MDPARERALAGAGLADQQDRRIAERGESRAFQYPSHRQTSRFPQQRVIADGASR